MSSKSGYICLTFQSFQGLHAQRIRRPADLVFPTYIIQLMSYLLSVFAVFLLLMLSVEASHSSMICTLPCQATRPQSIPTVPAKIDSVLQLLQLCYLKALMQSTRKVFLDDHVDLQISLECICLSVCHMPGLLKSFGVGLIYSTKKY